MKKLFKQIIKFSALVFVLALTGCVSTETSYIVYNHDNDGGQVPLYTTPDIENAKPFKFIDSKTECALIEVKSAKGVHQIGLGKVDYDIIGGKHKAEEMLYVKSDYVRERIKKYWTSLMRGSYFIDGFKVIYQNCPSPAVKKAYETIHEWQESKFHYRWTNLTALGGLIGSFFIFFIALGIAMVNESKLKPIFAFLAFLTGLIFLFFQFVNFIILGGGYVPFIDFNYPDNFWGLILPAVPYIANLVLLSLVMGAVLYAPPLMGVIIAKSNSEKEEENNMSLNIGASVLAYIGTVVTVFITYGFHIAFIVTISLVTAFYLFLTIRELCKGNLLGLLYLIFPIIHIITGASLYRIGSIVLFMIIVVITIGILLGGVLSGLAGGGFNPFTAGGGGGGYEKPQVSLNGQVLDTITPSHGYSDEFRNPANGKIYGSNDSGRTLTEL